MLHYIGSDQSMRINYFKAIKMFTHSRFIPKINSVFLKHSLHADQQVMALLPPYFLSLARFLSSIQMSSSLSREHKSIGNIKKYV
jgi:hypothetical protein